MSTTLRDPVTADLTVPRVILGAPSSQGQQFADVVAQTIRDGLGLWLGEFFLDQSQGFNWPGILGVKSPVPSRCARLFRDFLLGVPGVVSVSAVSAFVGATRAFTYSFTATLSNGQVLTRNAAGNYNTQSTP